MTIYPTIQMKGTVMNTKLSKIMVYNMIKNNAFILLSACVISSCGVPGQEGQQEIRQFIGRPTLSIVEDRQNPIRPLADSGCINVSFVECFRIMERLHIVDYRALEQYQNRPAPETPIVPSSRPRRDFFEFAVRTPTASHWGYIGNLPARRRSGPDIQLVSVSGNSSEQITSVSLEVSGQIFLQENTFQRYDRMQLWPLFNDLLPVECRFQNREELYRELVDLGRRGVRSTGTSVNRFESVSDYEFLRSARRRCHGQISLLQHSSSGISVYTGNTFINYSRITFDTLSSPRNSRRPITQRSSNGGV